MRNVIIFFDTNLAKQISKRLILPMIGIAILHKTRIPTYPNWTIEFNCYEKYIFIHTHLIIHAKLV